MNLLASSTLPLFFKVANPLELGIEPPKNRQGDALTTWIRSLSMMQKEAIIMSSRTGTAWRLASDEGAYLNGYDDAPCPLSFLTTGMVSSYMNEILALAQQRGIGVNNIRLILNNYYTMSGSMIQGTMIGGALPVELEVQFDCDAKESHLFELLYDAVAASPPSGLMREQHNSLFTLKYNGIDLEP